MWCFLKDELLNDIVPTIMKFNKESDKVKAEALVKRIDDALVKTGTADSAELPKPMLKAYRAANAFSVKDCAAKLKETAEKLKSMDKDELLAKLGIKE